MEAKTLAKRESAADTNTEEESKPMRMSSKILFFVYLLYPLFRDLLGEFDIVWYLSIFSAIVLSAQYLRLSLRINACVLAWIAIALIALGSFLVLGAEVTAYPKRIITFVVTIVLMITLSSSRNWVKPAMKVVLTLLAVHAAATLFFMVVPSVYASFVKPVFFAGDQNAIGYQSGLTSHYSYNGMLLSAGVLLAVARALPRRDSKRAGSVDAEAVLLMVLFLAALLATTKRGPVVAVVIAVVVALFVGSGRVKTGMILKIVFGAVFAAAVVFALSQVVPQIAVVFDRLSEALTSTSEVDATNGRSLLWGRALELWRESPVVGHGWATYRYYWEGRIDVATSTAHNVFLGLLAEVGIVGLVVYLVAAIPPLVGLWRMARNLPSFSGDLRSEVFFAFSYQIFYLVYCFSGSPLYDIESYFFYLILSCGIWFGLVQSGYSRPTAVEPNGGGRDG